MSCEEARWPGFWNSVNSANSSKTIMTQRAKLRRLAFIDLPSWPRGSRPYVLGSLLGQHGESPDRLLYNLGAALVDAKGTTRDYLTHLSRIPAQIMAVESLFSGVVKTPRCNMTTYRWRIADSVTLVRPLAAAARRRFNDDPALTEADQGARKGPFQPCAARRGPASPGLFLPRPVQFPEQDLDLAEFRRPLMPESVDGTLAAGEAGFPPAARQRRRIECPAMQAGCCASLPRSAR